MEKISKIELFNKDIIAKAGARDLLRQKWREALGKGVALTDEIMVPFPEDRSYETLKALYYKKTIADACGVFIFGLLAFYNDLLDGFRMAVDSFNSLEDMYMWFMYAGIGGVLFYGGRTYKTCRLLFKYRDISKDIQKIGEALLSSLVKRVLYKAIILI